MCLQEEPLVRPLMSDIVTTSSFLLVASSNTVAVPPPSPTNIPRKQIKAKAMKKNMTQNTFREHQNHGDEDSTNQQDIEVDEGHKHDRDTGGKDEDRKAMIRDLIRVREARVACLGMEVLP
ncbi:hypothetical protein NL676_030361 [Syzygium grande]|nr:hypothetical protein NL676_030361 [Syzygium grande]